MKRLTSMFRRKQNQGEPTMSNLDTENQLPAEPNAPVQNGASGPGVVAPAVDISVFVADTVPHDDWVAVPVKDDTLYIKSDPALRLSDLLGIQAGNNDKGEGLLAVDITDTAKAALASLTTTHENLRLALIVGQTLVAAPTYISPVDSSRLIFPVGAPQDAEQLVRLVAGQATASQ
jgi:hypothetical protein